MSGIPDRHTVPSGLTGSFTQWRPWAHSAAAPDRRHAWSTRAANARSCPRAAPWRWPC